jgi:hypothetical protein
MRWLPPRRWSLEHAMASLVDLLAAVDDLPPSESGAFVVDGDDHGAVLGSVFVESSRVCWAAATGRSGRLRDLLHFNSARPIDDAELDDAFAECRVTHRPLGELLAERGLIGDDGLRAALKQHTVESLIAQCDGSDRPLTWVPHRRRGYRASFTFSPIELLAAAGAQLYPSESACAELRLMAALPAARAVGSFAIGDEDEPVAVWTTGGTVWRVRDLLELGDWAAAALAVCNGFSPAVMQRAVAGVTGSAAIGWRSTRRLVHAAVIDEPATLVHVIEELADRQVPAVLSSRIPVSHS